MKIPRLDYSVALSSEAEWKAAGSFLRSAMSEPGFLSLVNVPGYDSAQLQRWTRWFFQLTKEEKLRLRTNPYRGYVPDDPKASSSYKELYEIGGLEQSREDEFILYDATPTPESAEFIAFIRRHYSLMQEVGLNMLRMLAPNLPQEFLDHFSSTPFSTYRLIHYPERVGNPPSALVDSDGKVLHCQDHTDNGFLTLLATFNQPGLEIRRGDGSYAAVEVEEEALVVNIGDLMASLVGGGVKATRHRVVDHGVERFSAPFFLEPDASALVTPSTGETKPYGVFVLEKCTMFFEHRSLLERVRSDPRYKDLPHFRQARPMA